MMYKILTTGGRLLLTRDKGKALKALAEGGKKASQKFIEKVKSPREYYRKLKQRFKRRKSKEGDPEYKKKAAEKSARYYKHEMKMLHSPRYFNKAMKGEFKARQMERSMGNNPRVAGRTNPKSKTKIKGMPAQKKFKGGLIRKPKLALRGF